MPKIGTVDESTAAPCADLVALEAIAAAYLNRTVEHADLSSRDLSHRIVPVAVWQQIGP